MEKLKLKAEKRDIFGKPLVKARNAGKMPAVLYGSGRGTTPIFVDFADFKKIWSKAGESAVVDLELHQNVVQVLIYDVDNDPISRQPRHADFYAADMTKEITASVPLVFIGESPAVKLGGVLVKVLYEIEVEALPKDLPQEIKTDISVLESFDDKITIGDLKLSEGVKALLPFNEVVALVEETKEESFDTAQDKEQINMENIEVEKKGKKQEEEESKTE
ncbi:50S ribosomal protein L25 [Patescibacteria group bacterium]|nr:50S ribosomal protein L25 [Patescibacteria group bacterium]